MSVLDRQVKALVNASAEADAVVEASKETEVYSWVPQELIFVSISTSKAIAALVHFIHKHRDGGLTPADKAHYISMCKSVLAAMAQTEKMVRHSQLDYDLHAVPEFKTSTLDLRRLLAWLEDPRDAEEIAGHYDQDTVIGNAEGPPQSWHEADLSSLRRPK